jgi:GNAT superfamily N-acetyltransferase
MDSDPIHGQLRPMRREELDELVEWAAAEGWNPGRHDAEAFWRTDPDGFVAVELDGALAAGGSIVSYGGLYGFMGFFIVRPDLRGRGIGRRLWHERKRLLRARLQPGAPIGMDGVFAMQHFYAAGGFSMEHRELRFEAASDRPMAAQLPAARSSREPPANAACLEAPQDSANPTTVTRIGGDLAGDAIAYDALHFPAPRADFMRRWLTQPDALPIAALDSGAIAGIAVARPARTGMRIGPLFADSTRVAESLLMHILDECAGAPVHLDVPECNPAAIALAARFGMREIFGCAKMTLGAPPQLPWSRIFGVTSFELG